MNNYSVEEIYEIYGKSKKLKIFGVNEKEIAHIENAHFYSEKEIGLKEFYGLSMQDKDAYIRTILSLPNEEWTNTMEYIIKFFGPKDAHHLLSIYVDVEFKKEKQVINKKELPIQEDLVNLPEIDSLTKSDIRQLLDKKLINYPKWEWDLSATTPEKFIEAVNSFTKLDNYYRDLIFKYDSL